MNNFIREINGFYNNSVNCGETDSLHIERKYRDVLDKAGLVGDSFCGGENDYRRGSVFYSLFLATKK